MEGELWALVYALLLEEASKRRRVKRVRYTDAWVLAVMFWAVVHDRPMSWACQARHWPEQMRWRDLPSDSTLSERLRTLSVLQLLAALLDRLAALLQPVPLVRAVDGKPLPVGGFSKDRDARRGHATAGLKARGYKLFDAWARGGVVPEAWTLGPMSEPEPQVAAERLVPRLAGGGYLLGDSLMDSNPLHAAAAPRGFQLVAPRRKPGTGLGHREHEPSRLRSIELTEAPAPGDLPATGPAPFGRALYALRGDIERRQGNLCTFGGGLAPLPAWVRRPRRVARWVAAKLVLNGLRQCKLQGLTP